MADVTTLEPWERLFESAWRAVLRPSTQQRLGQRAMELLTPQNLAVFAVVMVAYVGGSAAAGPVGAVLNGIVGAAGLYALGKEILELAPILYKWGMTAWQAQTEAELEDAAGFFADGIVIIGPDLVLLLFGECGISHAAQSSAAKAEATECVPEARGATRAAKEHGAGKNS
jgi:hypothetical protein